MSNDGNSWHSDDELASALERALEIPAEGRGDTGEAYGQTEPTPHTASHDFSDLFAALTESEPAPVVVEPVESVSPVEPVESVSTVVASVESTSGIAELSEVSQVADASVDMSREQVFESLDDFKPRTNFIPVITPEEAAQSREASTSAVPVTSAHVTQPIKWDRQRPSFDELIFGSTTSEVR